MKSQMPSHKIVKLLLYQSKMSYSRKDKLSKTQQADSHSGEDSQKKKNMEDILLTMRTYFAMEEKPEPIGTPLQEKKKLLLKDFLQDNDTRLDKSLKLEANVRSRRQIETVATLPEELQEDCMKPNLMTCPMWAIGFPSNLPKHDKEEWKPLDEDPETRGKF